MRTHQERESDRQLSWQRARNDRALQNALATEIVCVLSYKMNAKCATAYGVANECEEHARDEQEHVDMIAERINQLGGDPNLNPEHRSMRSVTQSAF